MSADEEARKSLETALEGAPSVEEMKTRLSALFTSGMQSPEGVIAAKVMNFFSFKDPEVLGHDLGGLVRRALERVVDADPSARDLLDVLPEE